MGNKVVIKSINMEPYGGSGSMDYPVTIYPRGAYTNKQKIVPKTFGGFGMVPKKKVVFNEGGYVSKKGKK